MPPNVRNSEMESISYDEEITRALSVSKSKFVIWYTGSREQAEYISEYSRLLKGNSVLLPLPDSAMKGSSEVLSPALLSYFFLDFPDVIVSLKSKLDQLPVLGIEILEQKPVGWNHTQRFPRAAASASLGVPFLFLMPQKRYMFDKLTSEKTKHITYDINGEMYKENLREEFQLPFSLYKLTQSHSIPCLPFVWPLSEKNKFLSEGLEYNSDKNLRWKAMPPGPIGSDQKHHREIQDMFAFIDLTIEYALEGKPPQLLMNEPIVVRNIAKIAPETTTFYTKKHVTLKIPDGGTVKSAEMKSTLSVMELCQRLLGQESKAFFDSEEMKIFKSRPNTLLIEIDSDPNAGGRGFADPYSGLVASFDYRYCRENRHLPALRDRDANLVFFANNKNAKQYFDTSISRAVGNDYFQKMSSLLTSESTILITKKLFERGPFRLKKDLKNLFHFCDLILTPESLFVGKSLI
jgi:hypothetical protein